jgi:hypothetical protein
MPICLCQLDIFSHKLTCESPNNFDVLFCSLYLFNFYGFFILNKIFTWPN